MDSDPEWLQKTVEEFSLSVEQEVELSLPYQTKKELNKH
jgi:hypothetical protein